MTRSQFSLMAFHKFRLSNLRCKMDWHKNKCLLMLYAIGQQIVSKTVRSAITEYYKCIITCITREHCCHLMPRNKASRPAMTWARRVLLLGARLVKQSASIGQENNQSSDDASCSQALPLQWSVSQSPLTWQGWPWPLSESRSPLQPPFMFPSDNMMLPMYKSHHDSEIIRVRINTVCTKTRNGVL